MVGKAALRLYLGVWHSQTPHIYSWSFVYDKTPSYSAEGGIAIRWAFKTVELDELIVGFENKYRLLGFNTKGNMIEVLYNLINDRRINVFHAFPCSDAFIKSLSKQE